MKKTKIAAILSLGMVPAMFWSSESQAIPSWARKYNVSCYMCHSGFPQRNAVGEAFQNNGFRFPDATEAALTKQKNIKIGNDEWDKLAPNAPFQGSFPQFDALSMTLGGRLINYTSQQSLKAGGSTARTLAGKQFNWAAPNSVSLFYGGSLGDDITFFGQLGGFNGYLTAAPTAVSPTSQLTSNARVVYRLAHGFKFAMGTQFSAIGWNGVGAGGVVNVSGLLPSPSNYAELQLTRGETGGYSVVAGSSVDLPPGQITNASTAALSTAGNIDNHVYLRAKVKLVGAGMLSGANGTLGNSYNGLDNQVTLGFGLSSAKNKAIFGGAYAGETLVYGADIQAVHNNSLVGVAVSRDKDFGLNNVKAEAGYFVYPWLFAKVSYTDIANTGYTVAAPTGTAVGRHRPTVVPSLVAWVAPNVSVTATYTRYTKEWRENVATLAESLNNISDQNTFNVSLSAGF
ncbi:MAG: hypothetical protein FDX02_06015 [Chlorobium sp.]|nr:MAG: hypothetical protein FDX02_06015 [Chlorobium sp.]